VTPKARQEGGRPLRLLWPQAAVAALLVIACVVGIVRWALGVNQGLGTLVNIAWTVYDLALLSVLIGAAKYRGYYPAREQSLQPSKEEK
jgi:cellulose synthase (UDP-forming)